VSLDGRERRIDAALAVDDADGRVGLPRLALDRLAQEQVELAGTARQATLLQPGPLELRRRNQPDGPGAILHHRRRKRRAFGDHER